MKTRRAVGKAKKDLRDASHEVAHRVKAGAERTKRDVAGDAMTTTQKTKSVVREAGHRTAADVDKAKRKVRGGMR